jgi:hypothetical protein
VDNQARVTKHERPSFKDSPFKPCVAHYAIPLAVPFGAANGRGLTRGGWDVCRKRLLKPSPPAVPTRSRTTRSTEKVDVATTSEHDSEARKPVKRKLALGWMPDDGVLPPAPPPAPERLSEAERGFLSSSTGYGFSDWMDTMLTDQDDVHASIYDPFVDARCAPGGSRATKRERPVVSARVGCMHPPGLCTMHNAPFAVCPPGRWCALGSMPDAGTPCTRRVARSGASAHAGKGTHRKRSTLARLLPHLLYPGRGVCTATPPPARKYQVSVAPQQHIRSASESSQG